jgi:hypothetical protein
MLYCECPCVCCDTQVFLLPDGATGEGLRCPSCGRLLRATLLQPFGEADWLTRESPHLLSRFDQVTHASRRKRQLFACACCGLVCDGFPDLGSRADLELAEGVAEGVIRGMGFATAYQKAWSAVVERLPDPRRILLQMGLGSAAKDPIPEQVVHYVVPKVRRGDQSLNLARTSDVAALLRCIFGNPFRPEALEPDLRTWRSGLLPAAARRMLDSRDFSAMPILADMLEEAGCVETSVLTHCRGPGRHAAGCFVLDGLLGLE